VDTNRQTAVDPTAVAVIRRIVTSAVLIIALLTFAFGFGNGWQLGLDLGVPGWIAPLVAPAVDLSVIVLLVSLHYLRTQGRSERLIGPRVLLILCGLLTFALNTARAILVVQVGRACFDAVAPLLLIGWSEVGPRLLGLLRQPAATIQDEQEDLSESSAVVPARPGPSPALVSRARTLADEYQERESRAIPRDTLRAALKVSNATAGELLRLVRAPPEAFPAPKTRSTSHQAHRQTAADARHEIDLDQGWNGALNKRTALD
jgi:hypothetical protein